MMESKINMANTIAMLKLSSRETGSPALLNVTPSSLISSVDMTLTPRPIQVFDKKQAITFAPLQTNTKCQYNNVIDNGLTEKAAHIGWQEKSMGKS